MRPWGHPTMHLRVTSACFQLNSMPSPKFGSLSFIIRPLGLILLKSSSWTLLALILARKSDLRPSASSGVIMAEVLAVVASGIAVAQTADRVVSLLGPYIIQVKHAKEEIENLSTEVRNLREVLKAVSRSAVGSSYELDQEIKHCESALKNIQSRLDQSSTSRRHKFMSKISSRLAWPFKSEEVKEIINQLEHRKSNLSLYLGVDDR
jgi:predicted DNA-binding protein YlxM (UPF0122 family)